jgi:hypothetical protein
MKKFLFLLSSASIFLFSSCSSKKEEGGMSDKAKKNLETHRAVSKAFETKDFSKLGDYFAADAIDYAGEMGPTKGIDSIKAAFEQMSQMMSENKHETIKELADDDYVMAWMKFSGICNMDYPSMGMKKGQPINTEAIEVSQYKDGKVIAHWTFMQPSEFMKMMGGGQAPTAPVETKPTEPAKDTTSK